MPSILAYFDTPEQAEEVAQSLKAQGIKDVGVDRLHKLPQEYEFESNGPFPTSLTGAPLRDDAVLINADPSFGGLSAPGSAGGRNILLTVVGSEEELGIARKMIKDAGGLV
ncbi:MAG: hypothetical protein M1553_01010 [Firmicutes bacterium]|nr:hypothetical protein [Bacillota bacterium]